MAKKRAKNAKTPEASYITANYLELPQRDETFDAITAIETLCYIKDQNKPALLKEFYRVLKSGGRLVVYDGYINPDPARWKLLHLHARIADGWSIPNPISTAQFFVDCAKQAGFIVLENEIITARILSFSKAIKQRVRSVMRFGWLIRLAIYLRRRGIRLPPFSLLGLDHPSVLGIADTACLQYDLFAAGDTAYRIIVLKKP